MKRAAILALPLALLAFDRPKEIAQIDATIAVYKARIACMEKDEAIACIERHPLDPKGDTLGKTFAMSFPKSYYKNLLERNIKILERQKLCVGRAMSQKEIKECLEAP